MAALVGKALREARMSRGMTQQDVERAAGLMRSHISRIENGRRLPSLTTLSRLAEAIGAPLYTFFLNSSTTPHSYASPHQTFRTEENHFETQLWESLARLSDEDQRLLLAAARKMARRV